MKKNRIKTGLGRRIAAARKHAGLSQTELGKEFVITRSSVSQWESDDTEPTPSKLRAIAMRCGVSYEWLATGKGTMTKIEGNPKLDRITQILSELDPAAIDALEVVLRNMLPQAFQEQHPASQDQPPAKRK